MVIWYKYFYLVNAGGRPKGFAALENGAKLFPVPPGQNGEVGDIGIEVVEVRTIPEIIHPASKKVT